MSILLQQIQRAVGARPDGRYGPETERAIANHIGVSEPVEHKWPRDTHGEMRAFYGDPGENLTQIVPPYQLYYSGKPVNTITVHKRIADAVLRALSRVLTHYGPESIKRLKLDQYDGCYNNRAKRGGTSLSTHAFAAALDFAASHNPLNANHKTALFAGDEYKRWFQIWEEEGAVSLGREKDFDWMHIQFARIP